MGVISRNKNQINCIYTSNSDFGKQLEGYLKASGKAILMINLNRSMLTPTQWQELAAELKVGVENFIDISKIEQTDKNSNFDANDYVTILKNNPNAFKGALIINGDKTEHILTVTEVLEYFDVDSAGLEKSVHTEKTNINKTSEKDSFI